MKEKKSETQSDEESVSDFSDDEHRGRTAPRYKKTEKMIIMQRCFENPQKLFEKFGQKNNRNTLKEEWMKISEKLAEDGIKVDDISELRRNVNNWTRRALATNDKRSKTGTGKQKAISEFDQLCVGFVRAAKGDSLVDFIDGPAEPSGSSSTTSTPIATSSIATSSTATCSTATSSTATSSKATSSTATMVHPNMKETATKKRSFVPQITDLDLGLMPRKKTREDDNQLYGDLNKSKKSFFSTVENLEKERHELIMKKNTLKCYNLVLKNMCLEKELALEESVIDEIRQQVSPQLINFPKYATEKLNDNK